MGWGARRGGSSNSTGEYDSGHEDEDAAGEIAYFSDDTREDDWNDTLSVVQSPWIETTTKVGDYDCHSFFEGGGGGGGGCRNLLDNIVVSSQDYNLFSKTPGSGATAGTADSTVTASNHTFSSHPDSTAEETIATTETATITTTTTTAPLEEVDFEPLLRRSSLSHLEFARKKLLEVEEANRKQCSTKKNHDNSKKVKKTLHQIKLETEKANRRRSHSLLPERRGRSRKKKEEMTEEELLVTLVNEEAALEKEINKARKKGAQKKKKRTDAAAAAAKKTARHRPPEPREQGCAENKTSKQEQKLSERERVRQGRNSTASAAMTTDDSKPARRLSVSSSNCSKERDHQHHLHRRPKTHRRASLSQDASSSSKSSKNKEESQKSSGNRHRASRRASTPATASTLSSSSSTERASDKKKRPSVSHLHSNGEYHDDKTATTLLTRPKSQERHNSETVRSSSSCSVQKQAASDFCTAYKVEPSTTRTLPPSGSLGAMMIPLSSGGGGGGGGGTGFSPGLPDHDEDNDNDTRSVFSTNSYRRGGVHHRAGGGSHHGGGLFSSLPQSHDDDSHSVYTTCTRRSSYQPTDVKDHDDNDGDGDNDETRSFDSSAVDSFAGGHRLESAKDKIQVMFLEKRKKERAARLEMAKERIRQNKKADDEAAVLRRDAEKILAKKNQDQDAAETPVGVLRTEKQRRQAAYDWYVRMGLPSRHDYKKCIRRLGDACDVTVKDVDLLPWIANGQRILVKEMFVTQQE